MKKKKVAGLDMTKEDKALAKMRYSVSLGARGDCIWTGGAGKDVHY